MILMYNQMIGMVDNMKKLNENEIIELKGLIKDVGEY